MNYKQAEDVVCDGVARFCEALLENGFTHTQMEAVMFIHVIIILK
jgi:DNA-binding ferritin-like protein (Dps family)